MKKVVLLIVLLCTSFLGFSQSEFPYSKIMRMSTKELREAKFKYDEDRNQHVLRKANGLQGTANVLAALGGTTADIRPHVDDYQIVVQYGDEGVASLTVIFYKDETYHELLTFATDNGENFLETNSNTLNKIQFNYDGLNFELDRKLVGVSGTYGSSIGLAKSKDESYNIYTYSIFTGIAPNSPWHRREAAKQERRDSRGAKKRTASELM